MNFPEHSLSAMPRNIGYEPGAPVFDWMKEMILYEVYIRDFSREGTFKGVTQNLDRIENIGANAVWLMPIHPIGVEGRKGSLGCPYSIMDYRDVNPEYGTMEDFKELVEEVHKRGMKIFIDMVANHVSNDNINIPDHTHWFTLDEAGRPTRRYTDWSDVTDNNYQNRELWQYMKETLRFWIQETGIDGFRCDVAGMVPLDFWEEAVEELREIKPDLYMLAEWDDPNLCRKAFQSDYLNDPYQEMLKVVKGESTYSRLMDMIYDRYNRYPKNYLPLTFIENHDQQRATHSFGKRGFLPWAVLFLTLPGIPLIYNGQETGDPEYLSLFEKTDILWNKTHPFVLSTYQQLIRIRKENPVLYNGRMTPLKKEEYSMETDNSQGSGKDIKENNLLIYRVEDELTSALVLLNFNKDEAKIEIEIPSLGEPVLLYRGSGEKLNSGNFKTEDNRLKTAIPPTGAEIYLIKK